MLNSGVLENLTLTQEPFKILLKFLEKKRWNQLPKNIQAKILQGYADTGISLNVGKTQTQKELYKKLLQKKVPVAGSTGVSF